MPRIITKLEGIILDTNIGTIHSENRIKGYVGTGDYMCLSKFTGYFVDLNKAISVTSYEKPKNLGLKNNTTFVELNISY
jgi:hypothetical protein